MTREEGSIKVLLVRKQLRKRSKKQRKYFKIKYGLAHIPLKSSYRIPEETNTPHKLAEWVYENAGYGHWYAQGWYKKKCSDKKTRLTTGKALFEVIITKHPSKDYDYGFIHLKRIKNYWFWKKK